MWFLEVTCTAAVLTCAAVQLPSVQREFPTKVACDRALMKLAGSWTPSGGWRLNCVNKGRG